MANLVRNPVLPSGLTALLKEPAVRAGYLSGMTVPRLALAFGVAEYVMQDYVAERCWGWNAAEHRGIHEDGRRTVVFTRASRETGGYDIRPISVPRITMHVRALAARAWAASWRSSTPDLLPFRIHFEDPEIAPLDLDASDAENARQLAANRRGVPAGAIHKVKIIRKTQNSEAAE